MPRAPFLPLVLVLALATGAVTLAAGAVLASAPAGDATGSANEALVRRFYAAVNAAIDSGDVAALDPLLAPGFADHPAPADGTPARAALLGAVLALHAADRHLRAEVETVAAAGETVVVRGRLRRGGTAGAPTMDAAGAVAGGGRIDVFRVEGDTVAEHWGISEVAARCGIPTDQAAGVATVGSGAFGGALAAESDGAGSGTQLDVRWRVQGAAPVSTDPVVAGGVVYAGEWDGDLVARDAATGGERWRFATGDRVFAPPVVGDGAVYVVTATGTVYAVDAITGQERWRVPAIGVAGRGLALAKGTLYVASGRAPAPVVADAVVYVARGGERAELQALDAATGVERWRLALAEQALYAVEAASGREQWRLPLTGADVSAPVAGGEAVYLAGEGLRRVDAATGRVQWWAEGTLAPGASPAIGGGLVYLAEPDGQLRAFEAGTGAERWAVETGGAVVSSPVVAGGVVYLGSRDGHLAAVDAASGVACGRFALGDVTYAPAVVGGVAYVGTLDGRLAAVAVGGAR